jgi:leucyl/phenylalanyl-tRNA--protein transferase
VPAIRRLGPHDGFFPPTGQALDYPNGLLAVGGDLGSQRLLAAYRRGIFPWYEPGQPILWWTPDPRSVLFPAELHISRSLRRTLRRDAFTLSVDQAFRDVMERCGEARDDQAGSWIGTEMVEAYCCLHDLGYAHSIEVRDRDGQLVGGLYGIALGRAFFGESMFSRATDASNIALVALVHIRTRGGFELIDCQVESEHLNRLGARCISRLDFEALLGQTVDQPVPRGIWWLPRSCGELL